MSETTVEQPAKYSADWVRQKVEGAHWLDHHACAICRHKVGYIIHGDEVSFDSNCGCTRYWTPHRPASFQEIADFLKMQSSDEIRDKIMEGLHFPTTPA